MAEQLQDGLDAVPSAKKMEQGLHLIQRNSRQLLGLINQLLDLSAVDSGNLRLRMIQGDIVAYLTLPDGVFLLDGPGERPAFECFTPSSPG